MHKYAAFCVDVFLFFFYNISSRKEEKEASRCVFYAKRTEGQISHKVNPPVSDEGLVSGNKEWDPRQQEVPESPFCVV